MADIFVSYSRTDKARVAPLIAALEAQGWSVWWDPEITPGEEFDAMIGAELEAAREIQVFVHHAALLRVVGVVRRHPAYCGALPRAAPINYPISRCGSGTAVTFKS